MAPGINIQKRLIDPKRCYELWCSGISVYKIPLVLQKDGIYNEKNGKPFSPQGIFRSAGLYVVEHFQEPECRKIFNDVWKANGKIATDVDWYKYVLKQAKKLSPKKFRGFMDTHSYLKPYLEVTQSQ